MNKSLLLASMMVVALAACGKKEAPAPTPAPAPLKATAAQARRVRAATAAARRARPATATASAAADAATQSGVLKAGAEGSNAPPGFIPDWSTLKWARGVEGQRKADLGDGTFLNPIRSGDRPDPSIVKVGKTIT
jgi:hypothetical protein